MYTCSAEQAAIAAVAQRLATLDVPAHTLPQAVARPLALDALTAVDDDGGLSQGGACAATIKPNQCVAESLGLRGPWWRSVGELLSGQDAFKGCELLGGGADLAAVTEA